MYGTEARDLSCASRRTFCAGPQLRSRSHCWRERRGLVQCVTAPYKPKLSYVGVSHTARAADGMVPSLDRWAQLQEQRKTAPTITKPDTHFLKEHLEFVWGAEGIDLTELNTLFELVGFPKRDLGRMKIALDNTHAIIWVRSTKQSRWAKLGQLLGFARATSDKALSATVWDVAHLGVISYTAVLSYAGMRSSGIQGMRSDPENKVHPAWQRGGLGRGLVERLTASLVDDDIQTICLYAEPGVVGMYEKLGFVKDPHGIKGMAFQRNSDAGRALLATGAAAA